jgi:Na+/proline symporter
VTPLLGALLAYLALQLAIGAWASRRVASEDDYLVAGRKLGPGLATFSIFATWFGAETCIGAAGRAHAEGLSATSAEPLGYGLCLLLMGAIYAVPLWRRKLTTLADLYGRRFSPSVERVAAVLLVPGSLLWAAAQVRGFGQVIAGAGGLDVRLSVGLAAGFCILYTVFGGLLADAVTDLFQGVVLSIGLVALATVAVHRLGGPAEATAAFVASVSAREGGGATFLATVEAWAIPVCGSVLATELASRVIAARSPGVARGACLAGGGLYVALGAIPVFMGVVGGGFAGPVPDPEQILPAAAQSLLPGFAYVVFAGALLSAVLSTVDSTLLVASGLVSHNLVVPLLGVRSQRAKVALARGGVAVFGLVAWGLAARAGGVFELVEQASAFCSAGTFVTLTLGLFTRWGGPRTALATLLAGAGVYLVALALEVETPFLASLAAALLTYAAGAAAGAARERVRAPGLEG